MPSYQDYFNAYLGVTAPSKAAEKQKSVSQASQNKRTSLSGTDPNMAYQAMIGMETERGATTSSEIERDLVSLTPFELQMKYGDAAASEMLRNRNSGRQQLNSDRTTPRSWGEFFGDTALSGGLGFVNSLGGIAALGAGLVDKDAGVAVSQFMDRTNQGFRNALQSDALAGERRINAAKANLDNRDSQAAYEADKANGNETLAKFKRVGREAIGSIARSTEDGTIFADELANAAGSLFAAGPIAKPISAAGNALVNGAAKLGVASGAGKAFQLAQKAAAGAGVPAAIGLMEGGGAYQQTVMDVMAMKPEELAANSPRYQELLAQNIDPVEAQKIVANEAGRKAAAIQAPIGVATGMLVNRFEGAPLRFRAGNTVATSGKEGLEEGIQGTTGTLASNYAIQDTANQNRDLSQGVGEQLGSGALFGAGSAAAVRAPFDAAKVATDTAVVTMRGAKVGLDIATAGAKAVGGPVYQALIKRGDQILQRNAERSVVSEEAAAAATQQAADLAGQADVELKAAIDETAADDETKQKGFAYVDQLMQAVVWDDAEVSDPAIPEQIRSTLSGSANRFDAINRLTDLVDQSEPGSQDQLDAATALYEMLAQNQNLTDNQLVDAISELPDDHPTLPLLRTFEDALIRIQSTPKVLKALGDSAQIARAAQERGLLDPVADAEIGTPQGDQKVRNTLAVASHAPLEANPDANDKLLYHDERGDISLTPMQRAQLRVSSSLVRAERERLAQIEALGLTSNTDVVSGQITVDDSNPNDKQKSAAEHIKGVVAFMKAGETEAAQIALQEFVLFAKHMQNKVAALNEHLKTGEGSSKKAVHYEQLVPGAGRFRPSINGLWVNPNAPKTVQLAQTINNDAQTVGKLANDLVDVFPELGVEKVELVPLDPYLTDGTADEIKAKFQAERKARKNGQNQAPDQTESQTGNQTEEAPLATPEAELTFEEAANRATQMSDGEIELRLEDLAKQRAADMTLSERLMANAIRTEKARRAEQKAEVQAVDQPVEESLEDLVQAVEQTLPVKPHLRAAQEELEWSIADDKEHGFEPLFVEGARVADLPGWFVSVKDQVFAYASKIFGVNVFNLIPEAVMVAGGQGGRGLIDGLGAVIVHRNPTIYFDRETVEHPQQDTDAYYDYLVHLISHEIAHGVHLLALRAGFDDSAFNKSGKLYEEFRKLQELGLSEAPWFSYLERHEGDTFTQELIAEALSFSLRYPDVAQSEIPNVVQELNTLIDAAQATERGTSTTDRGSTELDGSVEGAETSTTNQEVSEDQNTQSDQPVETAPEPAETGQSEGGDQSVDAEVEQNAQSQSEEEKPTGLKVLFGSLIEASLLDQVFKFAAEAKTRIFGSDFGSPLEFAMDALVSRDGLIQATSDTDKPLNRDYTDETAEAYADLLDDAQLIKQGMLSRLAQFLKQPYSQKEPSKGTNQDQLLAAGSALTRYSRGKALNIVEQQEDGSLTYNEELLEAAILAGMQWLVTAENYQAQLDIEDVAGILGVSEADVPSWLTEKLNEGLGLIEAKRSLAAKIQEYWGLSAKRDVGIGLAEGIFESLAAELLSSMVDAGALKMEEVEVKDLPEIGTRKLYTFQTTLGEDSPLYDFPQAIDTAVLLEPEPLTFIGWAPEKVAPTQLRNPEVKHTKKQKKAIRFEQQTPHYLNVPMLDLVLSMGLPNIIELFGAGNLDNLLMNNEDRTSKEGLNRSFTLAYRSINKLVREVRSFAAATDNEAGNIPVFYDYVFTRVNRMQMLGASNPQANKLMREVVMPTQATIDLSDVHSQQFSDFTLALAQALGVKVHTMSRAEANKKVLAKLENAVELKPAVDMLRERLDNGDNQKPLTDEQMAILKKALGKKASVVSLHAVMEYARYKNAEDNELKAFTTSLYVEADGVTNGPVNAMQLITPGRFTPNWVARMLKGGLKFGPVATSMNYIRESLDGNDLYTTATNYLTEARSALLRMIEHNDDLMVHEKHLSFLMDAFLPNVTLVGEDLVFDRGVAKNPLTITIYGSGARGIAGNIVDELSASIYEKMSEALQRYAADNSLAPAQAMFPDDAPQDAEVRFKKVMDALYALNRDVMKQEYGIFFFEAARSAKLADFNFTEFKLSKGNRENLIDNVLTMFVEPLQEAIAETIGEDTLNVAQVMRQAVQVQSIALKHAFQAKVAEKLKAKKAENPDWVQEDFLSHEELRAILDELRPLAPMIQTVDQGYYIVGSESANLNDTEFGQALPLKDAPKFRTKGFVRGPGNAGVAGIPALIIGFGDGQMMLELSTMEGAPTGTLKVFDGMHIKLDSLKEDSQKANEAVFKSWMGNPLLALLKSYEEFAAHYNIDNASPAELSDLERAMNVKKGGPGLYYLFGRLPELLKQAAMEVEARHRAMARVSLSVDQMASVGAPYQHTGEVTLEGLDDVQISEVLNRLYDEEYTKLVEELGAEPLVQPVPQSTENKPVAPELATEPNIAAELATVGRLVRDGMREISYTALKKLARKINIPDNQKQLLNDVLKTLAAREYTVVFGDPRMVVYYAVERGFAIPGSILDRVNGFISVEDRRIYLFNPSSETLVHELLHAATFDKIAAYFEGGDLGANGVEQVRAIERLQELKKQFLELDVTQEDEATQITYLNAVEAIEQAGTEAIALNEFMAWSLANAKLSKLMEKTKASPLVQLARNVVEAIKKLIWGRRKSPAVADDMLSNVRFNTSILMQSKANAMDRFARTIMFHNAAYGNNDRVAEFNRTLQQKIYRYVTNRLGDVKPQVKERLIRKEMKNLATMTDMALWVEKAGFDLTTQERTTLNLVVATMMTAAELDANVLTAVQDLFVHVSKTLTVEHFMADPSSLNPNDRFNAQRKYDMVLGNMQRDRDFMGRSSVLPVFLGLAVVSDEFRSVLARLPMPEKNRKVGTSIDVRVDNIANAAMEKLSDLFSGNRRNSPDVQVAMDLLVQQLMDTVEEREGAMQQIVTSAGNIIDKGNDWIVDQMQSLAERAYDAAQQKKQTSTNKLTQTASSLVIGLSGIVNEKVNAKVAEGLMASMNRLNLWQPIQDLVSDLVGRTESNAPIFDMIKRARNMVQRARQQFREHLPDVLASKFTRQLTEDEWRDLHFGLGKTDIAVLRDSMNPADLRDVLSNERRLRREIRNRESELQRLSPNYYQEIQLKAYQLARFMNTGEAGSFLLSNAQAVAGLYGRNLPDHQFGQDLVDVVDELVTLYAFETISPTARTTIAALAQDQAEGLEFVIEYLVGQRKDEMVKAQQGQAWLNHYKGYMPTEHKGGMSLIVAQDDQQSRLEAMSYVRVGDYTGSNLDRSGVSRGYYLLKAPGRAAFSQGIFQNVHMTAYGVDPHNGYSRDMTAGRITDPGTVKQITRRIANERNTPEPLRPIFDEAGQVIAYERMVDPVQKDVLDGGTNLAKNIGIWRGRQLEEGMGNRVNQMLVERLHQMWADETQSGTNTEKMKEYVNVFSPAEMKKDPVLKAARDLLTTDTLNNIAQTFPQEFWVRRDMLKDAMGYHMASVGDAWTGTSRFSNPILGGAQKALIGVFGLNAYRYMVNAERILQNVVTEARILVVVKSVVVPVTNLMANIYQLWARGVPMGEIVSGMPRKAAEVNAYLESRLKLDELEAELRAVSGDVMAANRIEAQMRTIRDSHKRLSIWPLIEAGEFSSISDGTITHEEMTLTEGRVSEYIEKFVDRLPPSVRNLGRYAVISRDTSLFKGLQKAVEYGDFLAKAVLYEELTKRKGLSQEETLARITEEFVNYDRLPGRGRGYLESIGLLWFYNFKIRSTKVALSMIRNNPLHALMAMGAPHPDMIGSVGLPIEDNLVTLGAEGNLGWSMGPGMGLRSHELNPWVNLIN